MFYNIKVCNVFVYLHLPYREVYWMMTNTILSVNTMPTKVTIFLLNSLLLHFSVAA